ncbi:MAG: adenylate kinase [Bacillota bacterium]|nr:adenylate kinase [Bacillota bacterium]
MKLVLLGAPGAGKGTQAEVLSEKLGIPVISTGNMLRAAIAEGTEQGKTAEVYIKQGGLVPDDVVVEILKERLSHFDCKNGFILDGFPRSLSQAEVLDKMGVAIDRVISLEVPDEEIAKRLSGRRVCLLCGATYHIEYNPPKQDGLCNNDNQPLIIRDDDKPETFMKRLEVYHELTEPLKEYYLDKGILRIVVGQEEVSDTSREVLKALEG